VIRTLVLVFSLVLASAGVCAEPPAQVLFIGNSYTFYHRMPALVSAMARAQGSPREIQSRMVAVPSATLQAHWESGAALRAIRERQWDYVVLQEQSLRPLEDRELMFKYVRLFHQEIQGSGARTVLFLTWARQVRPVTQAPLNAAYTAMAEELGALVAPVGPAWQIAQQRGRRDLYEKDGSHPSPAGTYLTACVFYLLLQAAESRCPAVDEVPLPADAVETLREAALAARAPSSRR
jgi:hypothetical protein